MTLPKARPSSASRSLARADKKASPIIAACAPTTSRLHALTGCFNFSAWCVNAVRKTYDARTETVAKLPSFRESWAKSWRCIIPAESISEPNWGTGSAVRWVIQQPAAYPMGIAGIYRRWKHQDGRELFTFAMLTVNADGHPVMEGFHRPQDEKRMVVILDPSDYGPWLSCPVDEAPSFFKQWTGPLEASAAPLPPRVPKSSSARTTRPPKADEGGQLF